MGQPVSGDPWVNVGTVGSVVVANRSTVLRKVILPGTFVGTVQWFDSATVAGTSATNLIHTQGIPLLRQWDSYDVDAKCKDGLVYAATGTPTLTFTWD